VKDPTKEGRGLRSSERWVDKDAKGNLGFSGKINKHISSCSDKIEQELNFSISPKKEW